MSERKTAEIKFRVTPTEKARWQKQADVEEIGLSEMIRQATDQHVRVHQVLAAGQVPTEQGQDLPVATHCDDPNCWCQAPVDSPQEDVPATHSVDTSDEVGSVERLGACAACGDTKAWDAKCEKCNVTLNVDLNTPPHADVKPWMYEARDA